MADFTWLTSIDLTFGGPATHNGTNIYGGSNGDNNTWEYEPPPTDTQNFLGSVTSQSGPPVCFNGQFYVCRCTAGAVQVLRWNGSSYDTVLNLATDSSHTGNSGIFIDNSVIYLLSTKSPNFIDVDNDQYAKYSSDGNFWNDCSLIGDPEPGHVSLSFQSVGMKSPNENSVPAVVCTTRRHSGVFDFYYSTWEANGGTLTFLHDIADISNKIMMSGPWYWRYSGGNLQKADDAEGPWSNASSYSEVDLTTHHLIENLGLPDAAFSSIMIGTEGWIYKWDNDLLTWQPYIIIRDSVDPTLGRTLIRLDDGTLWLRFTSDANTFWYVADEVVNEAGESEDIDTGKRLWIYKGNGIDWVSRGLKVAD